MFVMTHDGKQILQARCFRVERTIGSKLGKFGIVIGCETAGMETPVLSYFPDEASAIEEMKKVWAAMLAGEQYYRSEKSL